MAGLTLKGQSLESYIYPSNVDDITRFAVALVDERWAGNPLSNYGKYGLLFSIGVPFEGKLDLMCIHLLISSVNGTNQVFIRTMWNKSWQGWKAV